jgi:hypothetical protein
MLSTAGRRLLVFHEAQKKVQGQALIFSSYFGHPLAIIIKVEEKQGTPSKG